MCDSKRASQPGVFGAGLFFARNPDALGWDCSECALHCATMLWVKSLHIVFITSWFAGLFYLPRIFVNLALAAPESVAERARLLLMARKLFRFTTFLAF